MRRLSTLLIVIAVGLIIWWWLDEQRRSGERLASPQPRTSTARDPLVDIDGIGPVYEKALNALGIFTFAQLAAQNADKLAERMSARVSAERIRAERWIEQASERLNG